VFRRALLFSEIVYYNFSINCFTIIKVSNGCIEFQNFESECFCSRKGMSLNKHKIN
jgi:hypothetical protein